MIQAYLQASSMQVYSRRDTRERGQEEEAIAYGFDTSTRQTQIFSRKNGEEAKIVGREDVGRKSMVFLFLDFRFRRMA